jgi:glycosyltransferase involved in cell wall biosynthesis
MSRISVFIPAYNEEGNLQATVHELTTALHARALEYEIIIVNDGSKDRTAEIAEALHQANPRVRVVHNPRNLGLAKTFWVGAHAARYEYVGWIPGDNGFPADSLEKWLAPLGAADLIQTHFVNTEVRYLGRRIVSRAYTKTMNFLFGLHLNYYNGIQIYRKEQIQSVQTSSNGFALLSEVLTKLLSKGCTYIDVAIRMQERVGGHSKAVTSQNILDVIKTVVRLFCEIRIVHRKLYGGRCRQLAWEPQPPQVLAAAASDTREGQ